ncbi:MAG: hypothetical protein ACI81P_001486 [Neolewinella sp.]|jgi:hypothetical protein
MGEAKAAGEVDRGDALLEGDVAGTALVTARLATSQDTSVRQLRRRRYQHLRPRACIPRHSVEQLT